MTQGEHEHRSPVCLNSWEICLTLLTQRKLIIETVKVVFFVNYVFLTIRGEIMMMMTKTLGRSDKTERGAGSGQGTQCSLQL